MGSLHGTPHNITYDTKVNYGLIVLYYAVFTPHYRMGVQLGRRLTALVAYRAYQGSFGIP